MTAPNDVVSLAAEQAAKSFGGNDGMFNGSGFGLAIGRIAGIKGGLDGLIVRAILAGRSDVEVLGGGHYRISPEPRR